MTRRKLERTDEARGSIAQGVKDRSPAERTFAPPTDLYETDDAFVLVMDLPGADERSVEVTLDRDLLTIRAPREIPRPEGFQLLYCENDTGVFERSFTLSDEVDRENVKASVRNGVLRVTVPKGGALVSRRIEVRSG